MESIETIATRSCLGMRCQQVCAGVFTGGRGNDCARLQEQIPHSAIANDLIGDFSQDTLHKNWQRGFSSWCAARRRWAALSLPKHRQWVTAEPQCESGVICRLVANKRLR